MNKYFILAAAFAVSMLGSVHAQTVAQNWTKSDCDGNSHTLFTELDSGCIVIMDFAMTHCIPCKIATIALTQLDSKYSASHPEKLRHYAMGYINSYTCDDMAQWKLDGNFTIPTMIKCAADVQNYGGMGMPTIVIVGGKDHKILYKRQGFVSKDTIAMIAAIDKAFAASSSVGEQQITSYSVRVTATGTSRKLEFDLEHPTSLSITIMNILGEHLQTVGEQTTYAEGHHIIGLPLNNFASGKYFVLISTRDGGGVSTPFNILK